MEGENEWKVDGRVDGRGGVWDRVPDSVGNTRIGIRYSVCEVSS